MTLSELNPGTAGRVVRWQDELSDRLLELGLLPGVVVEVLRKAPLGDPTAYRINNCELAISRSDAARIFVDVI